jgi:hypothetical protein
MHPGRGGGGDSSDGGGDSGGGGNDSMDVAVLRYFNEREAV